MIYLRTGLPGASKSLNSLNDLIVQNDGTREIYYNNVKLLMLDYEVASSFSGWFYGTYLVELKDKNKRKKLNKIIRKVHNDDEFVKLSDVPWLQSLYEASAPLDTWLYWVRKVYSKDQLAPLEQFLANYDDSNLSFEHLRQFNLDFRHFDNPREWFLLPRGAIIFLDECQEFFPPRAVGAKVPDCISNFETHRHKGWDIHLVTQEPKLMDVNIRRLTGRHIHYYNAFGGDRVTRYNASKCMDVGNYFDLQNAEKTTFKRPSRIYGVYFSAEIHTHKFRIPKFAKAGAVVLLLMVGVVWGLVVFLRGMTHPDEVKTNPDGSPVQTLPKFDRKVQVNQTVKGNKQDQLSVVNYLKGLLNDVYITGSVRIAVNAHRNTYTYSFSNSKGEIFWPESVGLVVVPVSDCFARLQLESFSTFLTCQPFYKYPVIEEREHRTDDSNESKPSH